MEKLLSEFSVGLFIWQTIIFLALLLLLRKFAWKPIFNAVNEREGKIAESLALAEKTKAEMVALQAHNENLLKEAKIERDAIIKDAKETSIQMIEEAKSASRLEAEKIVSNARDIIKAEKVAAISEMKAQVATFSVQIAEQLVRGELSSDSKQTALAEKMAADINLN